MLVLSFFILSIALVVMQTTLLQFFPSWLGKPDLLFLLVIFLAYKVEIVEGAILVFLVGLIMDTFSGIFLGLYPVIYLLVFFLLKGISKHTALNESVYQIPFAIISYFFVLIYIFLSISLLAPDNPVEWSWGVILLQALFLSVIAIPLFNFYELFMIFCTKKLAKWRPFRTGTGNRFR